MDIVQASKTSVVMTFLRCNFQVTVVAQGWYFSTWNMEAGRLGIRGQLGLYNKSLSLNK